MPYAMKFLIAAVLLAAPAQAMNWEGHDDWMSDHPAALEYQPESKARTSRLPPCDLRAPAINPYEQIPLPHQNCRKEPEKDPRRNRAR